MRDEIVWIWSCGECLPLTCHNSPSNLQCTSSTPFLPPLPRSACHFPWHVQAGIRKRVPGGEKQVGTKKSGFRITSVPGPCVETRLCRRKDHPPTLAASRLATSFSSEPISNGVRMFVSHAQRTTPHYSWGRYSRSCPLFPCVH